MTTIDIIQSIIILLLAVMAFSNSFMINEFNYSWIHISYNHEYNRKSLLEAYKESGKTKYKYHTIEKGL